MDAVKLDANEKLMRGEPLEVKGTPIKIDDKRRERDANDALARVTERLSLSVKDDRKRIESSIANAIDVLTHHPAWQGVLAFNDRRVTTMFMNKPPFADEYAGSDNDVKFPRAMNDSDATRIATWGDRMRLPGVAGGLRATPIVWAQATEIVARQKRFDPVRDYLTELAWDGVPRLGLWLSTYLGVTDSKYSRAVGTKWVIAGVARAFDPGCKVDTMLILEGSQGQLKSSALEALAGGPEFFVDHIPDLHDKDAKMQIHGPWIVEFGELDALSRHDATKTKAFLTTKVDSFRPPYGMRVVPHPRRCIFAGTTNAHVYLKDETGGRRFWPVTTGAIDLASLRRDRDQLWAEAVVMYRADEPWWIQDEETLDMAKQEQHGRYQGDPWDEAVEAFVTAQGRERVTIGHVLSQALGISVERQGQSEQVRVQRKLTQLGWVRRRVRVEGRATWMYCAPVIPLSDDEVGSECEVGSAIGDIDPTDPTAPTLWDEDVNESDPTDPTLAIGFDSGGIIESADEMAVSPTDPTAPTESGRVVENVEEWNSEESRDRGGHTGISGNTTVAPPAPDESGAQTRARDLYSDRQLPTSAPKLLSEWFRKPGKASV